MAAKREFDCGSFIGQHFGARGSCMITEFIVDQNGCFNFRAATQNVPDTVAMLMTLEPFEIGKTTCCDPRELRIQPREGGRTGIIGAPNLNTEWMTSVTESS